MQLKTLCSVMAIVAVTTVGCQSNRGPKETGGAVLGGVGGAILGSQIDKSGTGGVIAIGLGTLLGAMLGAEVGASLDAADRAQADQAASEALERYPSGQTARWENPDSGHYGTVTPTRTYQNDYGQDCRDFQTSVVIDGRTETATGRACRVNGRWQVVS